MERKLSKTKIEKRMREKTNSTLVNAIVKLKKSNPEFAKELARPKRRWPSINLKDVSMIDGDVIIPGKILSGGDLDAPKKIVAWAASDKAKQKIQESNGVFLSIQDEIKNNPQLNNLTVVK